MINKIKEASLERELKVYDILWGWTIWTLLHSDNSDTKFNNTNKLEFYFWVWILKFSLIY